MESFEAVYEELFPQVYRYLLVLCGDRDLAEELAQETFFQAIQHIDSFRGDCKLYVWPVSYTHLDVYKRQLLWFPALEPVCLNSIMPPGLGRQTGPVL